jgi:serine-type D-Ala-D-Ala carboxypeptidase (penicillin-binding protein 5/6)
MKLLLAAAMIMAIALTGEPAIQPLTKLLITPSRHYPEQPAASAIPQPVQTGQEELVLAAQSIIAIDLDTAQVLFAKDAGKPRPIASITKLATALVLLDQHKPDQTVTIPAISPLGPADAKLGIVEGQTFALSELLKALLIPSANDVAEALAIWDAGNNANFSAKMNDLVARWGIQDMHFSTPSGLTEDNNYASAEALGKLAKLALTNKVIAETVTQSTAIVTDATGKAYHVSSTNQLLADKRVKGLKTGYTLEAGQSFVGLTNIKDKKVITVVLNSPDRFGETAALINWIERNYQWH